MIKVLVTGANGQLGHCIKDIQKKNSHLSFVFTDHKELDICDEQSVNQFFKEQEPIHYCVNCAAYTAVDKAEEEEELAFKVNAEGPKNLAIACKEHGTVLIHISTDFVFDGKKSTPYLETDEPNPISVYGASKLQGEIEVQNLLKECFIIRTSWLYSEYGNNFMKTMLRLAETRDEISVVSDQIGTPTYAGDLAEVILQIINSDNKNFGLFHYSNEGVANWYDFAVAIFDIHNNAVKVNAIKTEAYPTPAKRPVFSVLDKSKIKNNLILEIPHWFESLNKTLRL
ncbi:dTDP-4-dehydrorhamnose reductase [Oceanihabitans sp. IOP_32]|uniref:dTDP-4-dehydrorhamnose reductase n=1 Tax=Oceanihabitans sp. IOP_32 TaxID=2529032 RepID=UPI001292F66C|nr:dTDP-4-dehydrorhamnose reductase [Oceanihabitans sp. IOP_32]QFZ54438.1 dTDP-4-dehydrorhamnose reductase [Oceanihabitans sp. IOP_32]